MVDPLSRLALEWTPIYPMKRTDVVLDIFKHHISYKDGLPPYAQARIIDLISNRLLKARSYPGLWISVDAPGVWFLNEIRRFVKRKIPIAILPADRDSVVDLDFHEPVRPTYISEKERPVLERRFDPREYSIKKSALRVLRILARLKAAYRTEIASMAGLSESQTRSLLKKLQMNGLIEQKKTGKYNGWAILNKGVSLAHRSWNIPKGVHFTKYRGEFRYAGERHRRVSRLWRAWLEAAYPSIDIRESWTEVAVRDGIPDALTWGRKGKHEILFWLEVDTGHSSKKTMHINYGRRLRLAYEHSREWGTAIVFCLLVRIGWWRSFDIAFPVLIGMWPSLDMIGASSVCYQCMSLASGAKTSRRLKIAVCLSLMGGFLLGRHSTRPSRGTRLRNYQNPNLPNPDILIYPLPTITIIGAGITSRSSLTLDLLGQKGRSHALIKVA